MAQLIFKCPYLKGGGTNTAHLTHLTNYIATREGVEFLTSENKNLPATKKQEELIKQLLKDFPNTKNLFEYEDYLKDKTIENASEFISMALEYNIDIVAKKENYVDYIANRPMVEKISSHGLFTAGNDEIILSQVADEVANHGGNVWLPIIALKGEDAIRSGYDNSENWKMMLEQYALDIARNLKIPDSNFRWYAAFHHHKNPHIHMICYSTNPKEGYLSKTGIKNIKSGLIQNIYGSELQLIYAEKTIKRDELKAESKKAVEQLILNIASGEMQNESLEKMLVELSENLKCTKGKRVYGYLPPRIKKLVDELTDELCKQPSVAKAYDLWYELQNKVVHNYTDKGIPKLPLSQQKEFKSIKNHIIYEADKLSKGEVSLTELDEVEQSEQGTTTEDEVIADTFIEPIDAEKEMELVQHSSPFVDWTKEYKQAHVYLFGDEDNEPDFDRALELLQAESQNGNTLAVFDLGRIYADGLGVEIDLGKAQVYYAQALDGFELLEMQKPWKYLEYRIGKMYAQGLGTEQNLSKAVELFTLSADRGNEWAAYSLGKIHLTEENYKDIPKAIHLLTQSAEKKNQFAQYQFGKLYLQCDNIPQDINKAVEYLTASAEQKNQFAEYQLGKLYIQGEEIQKDNEKAIHYLTLSAEQGNQFPQYILGKLYLMGKEVERDKETAIKWFTLSAEQGNEYAQFFLDNMDKWKDPSVSSAAIRLLHHISKIFEDKQPQSPKQTMDIKIDSKRLRKLREKKLAAGQKLDDHSPQMYTY